MRPPKIDGFSTAIFTSSWDVIKEDILAAVNEILILTIFPPFLSHTAIVLIPKKRVMESLGDFRPISLCAMVYKIFAKLMCNRHALLLPKHVSLNQGAFIW